jgi:protein O-mannosyl-transferase
LSNVRLAPALVALVAFAVFANTLSHQFVYDDHSVIVENPLVHDLSRWREIISNPWWPRGLYRPFTSLTLAANWAAAPAAPFGFHLVNVLAHGVAAALVCLLAARLLSPAGALAAGLLFAVHPVHVEAVANVVGRAEILAGVFVLAASLCYLAYGDTARDPPDSTRRRTLAAAGTLGAGVLALASKESAFALPGLLLVADWARARIRVEPFGTRIGRTWPLWLATLIVSSAWLWLRAQVVGELAGDLPAPGLTGTGVGERIVIMLPVVAEYLRLFLFPLHLSAEYSPDFLPASPEFGARALSGLLLLGACVFVALALRHRAPMVTAGLTWTATALFVIGNVLVPSGVLLAERTLYIASVGVCLAAGFVWDWLYLRRRRAAIAVLAVLLAAASVRTFTRSPVWRDDATFFPVLVADAPGSYRAEWVAGMLSYLAGDSLAGERHMRQGLGIYSGNGAMLSDFAVVMERQRRWGEAAKYFWASFAADSGRGSDAARAVANHVQAGHLDSAQVLLEGAQRILPESRDLAISESHLALARGDAARSLALRWKAAKELSRDWRYWHLTAEAAVRARNCEALAEAVERGRELRPGMRRLEQLADSAVALGCGAPSSRTK